MSTPAEGPATVTLTAEQRVALWREAAQELRALLTERDDLAVSVVELTADLAAEVAHKYEAHHRALAAERVIANVRAFAEKYALVERGPLLALLAAAPTEEQP